MKKCGKMYSLIRERLQDSIRVKQLMLENEATQAAISKLSNEIIGTIKRGNKVVLCGNGGSAADALHFAGEIVGRFQKERNSWPAIALNSDVAVMTSIANDYGYENIFARQVEGCIHPGDVFIGISTSGNSENIYRAVVAAKRNGALTAALLGNDGGKIGREVEQPIVVPSTNTARIQESHITLIHIICEMVERDEL